MKRAVVSLHQVIFATTLLIIAALCAAPSVQAQTFTYVHTDALGSPVAKTNASKAVVSITRYEPYGLTWAGNAPTIGFTGHVNDADTGLTYMQQRYYDPLAGRLLSIDPVTTDSNDGGNFNRYAYANNSPYKYVDPDGRFGLLGAAIGTGIEVTLQLATEGRINNLPAIGVAAGVGFVTGGLGGVIPRCQNSCRSDRSEKMGAITGV